MCNLYSQTRSPDDLARIFSGLQMPTCLDYTAAAKELMRFESRDFCTCSKQQVDESALLCGLDRLGAWSV